jgi:uncharacterized protein YijF (DUF1287 family)
VRLPAVLLAVPLLVASSRESPPLTATATVTAPATAPATATATATATPSTTPVDRVVARAREEVARGVSYDPAWHPMHYPNGDVDASIGVCTDVVIRGYRAAGVDLQKLVHEDVMRAPTTYERWVKTPDATIDHRRVGPLLTYLRRHARSLPVTSDFAAGDVVVISFTQCPSCGPQHIGVVSDKKGPRGVPLLIHNMGPTPREDDTLDAWTLLGHFRVLN